MTEKKPAIIYADASLLVINKPAGVLSVPDGYDQALPYVIRLLEPVYGRLWVVHRLDKDTSGVMVLARNSEVHGWLNTQFAERQVSKVYHAIIHGSPDWDEKIVDLPLRSNVGRRNRTVVDNKRGRPSLTRFRVLKRYPGYVLMGAQPKTGRTHQIRAHLYDLGFAILSDPLYGSGNISPFIPRLALHARSLTFRHPITRMMQTFEASYPQEFKQALSFFRDIIQGV